ncbi:cytochrome P450 [Pseudoneurospora amorphoporcata]|uniref:Cytochrome P450 n=1 Tax=Pseudoneurospora amorphoporcata TaxID=241081 RepID=A0AAN6P250_9PEZI|nr:cytochrome P450 [Pseudoneurospora amorphoporcata]
MTLLADLLLAVTWWHVAVAVTVYYVSRTIYRLTLHPLAKFPGPKLAAITRLYEGYYDVIQEGQYTFKIAELHKQYGPIIRISPYELHINDPTYYEKLYRNDGRWDKYDWAYVAHGRGLDVALMAQDHYLHKAIRQPLSPFFSKANVGRKMDIVRKHLDKLQAIMVRKAVSGETFDLGAAISAWARDVSNEFILGKSYDNLDKDDFDRDFTTMVSDEGRMWRYNKHFPVLRLAFSLPWDFMLLVAKWLGDKGLKNVFTHLKVTLHDTKQIMDAHNNTSFEKPASTETNHTIINDILSSPSLPTHLKSLSRIHQDIFAITAAGFETTASTLRLIIYHLFSSPSILSRLRSELSQKGFNLSDPSSYEYRDLEHLPYLTAILMEGLRLSPAAASRLQRVAPDRELVYPQPALGDGQNGGKGMVTKEWTIPRGTPVGMTQILMHWDESVYGKDAKEFNPERWMDEEFKRRVAGGERMWAPFSRGSRNCLGMHLAWAELYLCIATLAQHFDLEFPGHSAEDFEAAIDSFVILTKSRGELRTVAKVRG